MPVQIAGAPPAVTAALDRLLTELQNAAGANFAGLILYGGLARGRFRPGKSDVNVVVLLREASAQALAAIAPALGSARRAAAVIPIILTPAEVAPTATAFPTKFLDIKDHHIVLFGENPFAGIEVPREQVRIRIVQELRNQILRLRQRYLAVAGDQRSLAAALTDVARPVAIELAALLRLAGKPVSGEDRTAAIFAAAATAFQLDTDVLARLAALRQNAETERDLASLFAQVLTTLARTIEVAEAMS